MIVIFTLGADIIPVTQKCSVCINIFQLNECIITERQLHRWNKDNSFVHWQLKETKTIINGGPGQVHNIRHLHAWVRFKGGSVIVSECAICYKLCFVFVCVMIVGMKVSSIIFDHGLFQRHKTTSRTSIELSQLCIPDSFAYSKLGCSTGQKQARKLIKAFVRKAVQKL